jgi:hypothetical protein
MLLPGGRPILPSSSGHLAKGRRELFVRRAKSEEQRQRRQWRYHDAPVAS